MPDVMKTLVVFDVDGTLTQTTELDTKLYVEAFRRALDLDGIDTAPDHTTLSRRGQLLDRMRLRVPRHSFIHLVVDSTGLSIVGEGEWAAAKHGRQRLGSVSARRPGQSVRLRRWLPRLPVHLERFS